MPQGGAAVHLQLPLTLPRVTATRSAPAPSMVSSSVGLSPLGFFLKSN